MPSLREERILRSGSEPFIYSLAALAAGVSKEIDPSNDSSYPAAAKYMPLDFAEITNDDIVPVFLIINQTDKFYCPASTIKAIKDKPIWRVGVQNAHATTATTVDKIKLVLQRLPITVNTELRRQHSGSRYQ